MEKKRIHDVCMNRDETKFLSSMTNKRNRPVRLTKKGKDFLYLFKDFIEKSNEYKEIKNTFLSLK